MTFNRNRADFFIENFDWGFVGNYGARAKYFALKPTDILKFLKDYQSWLNAGAPMDIIGGKSDTQNDLYIATRTMPFTRCEGLCINFALWACFNIMGVEKITSDIYGMIMVADNSNVMTYHCRTAVNESVSNFVTSVMSYLDASVSDFDVSPFATGHDDDYFVERRNMTAHQNEKRIAWVAKIITDLENSL